jgi:putative (di)nucleoside polyphosphate hydrolase
MARVTFRAGVGAVVRDSDGSILVLRRKGVRRGAWQLPQGGLDSGETPLQAVRRELREETGLGPGDVRLVLAVPGWLAYELPARHRSEKVGMGQVQRWYLFALRGPRSKVAPDGVELGAADWVDARALVARAAPFRRELYRRLVEEMALQRGRTPRPLTVRPTRAARATRSRAPT